MSHMATEGEHQEKQALKLSIVRQLASQRCLRAPQPASWQHLSSASAHLSPTATLTLSPTATLTCMHEMRPLLSLEPINKGLSLPTP